ncbi:MAG: SGNH/GDSL hydrolase family protein [Spirochaetae bacterium HGW-Spirochaetae-3]|jgi:lysophospholipase L1-like esterase|nr:MAG: SGNH/GDSL hydrolase family protein [Spirochaetae bacterium HGW-Spirochaetae-3]
MNLENMHINIWGDSILKGVVLDEANGRYQVLENNCVDRFAKLTGSIINNHASFGMTTGKALDRIKKSMIRKAPDRDDIVLIEFGGNDCDFRWDEVSANPEGRHSPKTPIGQFGEALQAIIDLFKSIDVKPVLMALPPLEPARFLDWVSRGLNRANILAWLGDVNRIYRWQEAYSDIVVQTANANGLRVIDVRKDFLVSDGYAAKFCADGMHPNEAGQAVILESILSYVRSA